MGIYFNKPFLILMVKLFYLCSLMKVESSTVIKTISENDFENFTESSTNLSLKYTAEEMPLKLTESLQHTCYLNDDTSSARKFTKRRVKVMCTVTGNMTFDFLSFRIFTSGIVDKNILFSLIVICQDGGTIFFPYPGRAKYLHSLHIANCFITGYRSEMRDESIDLIPDDIKYFKITDSIIVSSNDEMPVSLLTIQPTTLAFDCGPLNAIKIIERNVTFSFANLTSMEVSDVKTMNNYHIYNTNQTTKQRRCKYNNLRFLDRSLSVGLVRHNLVYQIEKYIYPKIEVLNLSSSGISEIPAHFYDWRLISRNMTYLDLSFNQISDLGSFTCHPANDGNMTVGIINLRNNNITLPKYRSLDLLFGTRSSICDGLLVDIRNNPFACNCDIKDFIEFVNNANYTEKERYRYMLDLKCFNPPVLRGKLISNLSQEQIGCEILLKKILTLPIIVLCCLIIVLSMCIILGLRYRKEIIILAYTRLHILIPFHHIKADDSKKYDAFIAYSEADFYWVIFTLAKRLENAEFGRRFSLCLHHRDFVVGAAISDNIVRSVERSRHTLIVVSKNFLRSEWCLLEFRTALHQSLLERKRHLIIILLEDIPVCDFEPELKRCLQTLTYVKADDRWFWDKLVYALSDYTKPDKNGNDITRNQDINGNKNLSDRNENKNIMSSECEIDVP